MRRGGLTLCYVVKNLAGIRKAGSPDMRLYKYYSRQAGLQLLDTLKLRFTPPKYFNDVGEMSPFIESHFSLEEYRNHFCTEKYLEDVFKFWRATGLWSSDYQSFVKAAPNDHKIYAEVYSRVQHACKGLRREFKNVVSTHTGVCCLSETPTSNLMWAHYADSHKGFCIEFNFELSDLTLVGSKAVTYQDQKVKIPPWFLSLSEEERNTLYMSVSFTKGTEWKHELEHRLVASLERCQVQTEADRIIYYQALDKRDITSVIIGIQSDCEMDVRRIVKNKAIPAEVKKCSEHHESFALNLTT